MSEYSELHAAAYAIREGCGLQGMEAEEAMLTFDGLATPDVVLGLIAENEANRHEREVVCANYDQLKAECEGLRVDAGRYRWLLKNATIMLKQTISYATSIGLVQTCYPSPLEMDVALNVAMGKGEQS